MQILILHNSQIDINVPKQSCNSEITEIDSKNQPFLHCFFFIISAYYGREYLSPDVILFESTTISLTFEVQGSLGIPRPAPSAKNVSMLGAGLRIPSDTHSSKLRLIVLLSNRMTSGIHAQ